MYILFFTVLALPLGVFAATVSAPTDLKSLVALLIDIIEKVFILVFAATFFVFAYGLIKNWVLNGGDATKVASGKKIFSAAVIGFVFMVSVWGILKLLQTSILGM